MKIGLFFGSYNPIHIGHLIIGNYVVQEMQLDQVWFVVSPQSPFKKQSELIDENHRLRMAQLATASNDALRASDVEFPLPRPSYTIDTLTYLHEKYASYQFSLLMGSDNLQSLPEWKNYQDILDNHDLIIYLRPGSKRSSLLNHGRVRLLEQTPLLNISSTFLRKLIAEEKSIAYLVPEIVESYITQHGLFK
jgi:nicotinate-nucleotide adenylyltransferase